MNVLQTWLIIGIPGLVIAAALFVGRSRIRAILGYATIAGVAASFAVADGGGSSIVIVGVVALLLVAVGRGTYVDTEADDHHKTRRRYTTANG
ncbi:MAG: hypothetical protein WD576_05265 [Nitriliruptoraceae bacterium]